MTLTIDLYANDGSPMQITPPDIYGRGVGGAELSMMTWAETMARRGHRIRIYNNPALPGPHNGVEYLAQGQFVPSETRDVFIAYRSPNPHLRVVKAGIKLAWSTDQQTVGNFATDLFPHVDRIVCISPYHVAYHKNRYGVEDDRIGYFDLGVRLQDYDQEVERIPGRCIFCSIPDRGLPILRAVWAKIREAVSEATLVITSDYTLWGAPGPLNHQHRMEWLQEEGVTFLGKVDRVRLAREQLAASCQSYPCDYEELFCISAAECQVSGAIPVTSNCGALRTTNQWGYMAEGDLLRREWQSWFVDSVVEALQAPEKARQKMQRAARKRFSWDAICNQWEALINTGEFEPERAIA